MKWEEPKLVDLSSDEQHVGDGTIVSKYDIDC